jgi:hypothetical protein
MFATKFTAIAPLEVMLLSKNHITLMIEVIVFVEN